MKSKSRMFESGINTTTCIDSTKEEEEEEEETCHDVTNVVHDVGQ